MFDGVDFSKMGEMLNKAQENAAKMQEEAKNKTFSAKSGGGMVSVSMNGANEIIDMSIDDSLLEDKESLQILLMSATNDVLKMAEEDKKLMATQMLTGLSGFGNQ